MVAYALVLSGALPRGGLEGDSAWRFVWALGPGHSGGVARAGEPIESIFTVDRV
jgi:hypothetical protein